MMEIKSESNVNLVTISICLQLWPFLIEEFCFSAVVLEASSYLVVVELFSLEVAQEFFSLEVAQELSSYVHEQGTLTESIECKTKP